MCIFNTSTDLSHWSENQEKCSCLTLALTASTDGTGSLSYFYGTGIMIPPSVKGFLSLVRMAWHKWCLCWCVGLLRWFSEQRLVFGEQFLAPLPSLYGGCLWSCCELWWNATPRFIFYQVPGSRHRSDTHTHLWFTFVKQKSASHPLWK